MTNFLVIIANAGDGDLAVFDLDPADESPHLDHLATSHVGAGCGSFVIDPDRDLVYAATKAGPAVVSLKLDRTTGRLAEIARMPLSASAAYLALAQRGKLLLGASYGGGFGFVAPLSDGLSGAETAHIEYPNLHAIIASADGRHVYATSLGADLIAQYALDSSGVLTPLDPPTVAAPPGSGPRHIVLSADGTGLYCVTEFTGEAIRYQRDPATGLLRLAESVDGFAAGRGLTASALGVDPKTQHVIWGADIHLSSDERFLLVSERRESTLATIALDGSGRQLRQIAVIGTEPQPRGFCVVPGTDLVVVVGERSTNASVYRLSDDGTPQLLGSTFTGNGANWVRAIAR